MKPPVVACVIVRLFSDAEDRAFLLHDLADRFQDVLRAHGARGAPRWYWAQALSVVTLAFRLDGDRIRLRNWAGIVGDLRFGVRTLPRRPLYAMGVAGTLWLGVATATLAFAVASRVWLAAMPYPDPDRVVRLNELGPADPTSDAPEGDAESRRHRFSPTPVAAFRNHSFQTISAVSTASRGELIFRRAGAVHSVSRVTLSPDDGFGILGIVPRKEPFVLCGDHIIH